MELEYDPHKKGYILKNPPFEPYELRLMVDSIQSSKFITADISRKITAKIKTLADKETVATLNRQAQVADRVRSMNESVVKDADRIHAAIAADSKIAFRYFHYSPNKNKPKSYSKSGEQYIVSPYTLLWNDGNYYLYAYVSENERFQMFRVDRMERIMPPLMEKREGKELYRAETLIDQKAKVFGMYHGEAYRVHMRIINRLADAVIDQFGKDTILVPDGNYHFTTTVFVEISPPFFAWVTTFGKGVQILSPEPVIEGMKKFIKDVSDMYKDEETSGKA